MARQELAQADEIEKEAAMLRAQIRWNQEEIRFQSGLGPAPSTANPNVGRQTRTQGAAGNVGSAPVAGATSGANAQRFSNTPQNTQQYVQFLHQDISQLRTGARQLDAQAEHLENHAHTLLGSIRGKSIVPDITITAGSLRSLINSYYNPR